LRSLLPRHWRDPQAAALKPWARAVVTVWVLVIVPLLLVTLVLMVLALPRVIGTAGVSLAKQWHALGIDWAGGDVAGVAVRMLALVAIVLPLFGSLYILVRLVRRTTQTVWRATSGRPGRRAVAGVVAAALVLTLGWAWWPDGNRYRPIQKDERGTILDAFPSAAGFGSAGLREGQRGSASHSVWASTSTPPTRDHPQLALVLVPKAGAASGSPSGPATSAAGTTWVFPFNRPGTPGEGDNQALAVNTTDGSTAYDVAFALVWADDGSATNRNEAYAFASCRACRTVAVAFQVVLIVGQADVAIPQNLSGAVNYSCVECVTYALASQLVLSVPGELTPDTRARLDALWQEIAAFGAGLQGVPLDQIRARLLDYQDQIRALVAPDPGSAPSSGATTQPPGSTAGPGSTPSSPPAPTQGASGTTAARTSPAATASPPAPSATTAAPTSTPTTSTPSPSATAGATP
jgi:putative peptide zinc metalloprotease protein